MRGLPLGDYRCTCTQLGLCSITLLGQWRFGGGMCGLVDAGIWHGLSPELGVWTGDLQGVMWVPVSTQCCTQLGLCSRNSLDTEGLDMDMTSWAGDWTGDLQDVMWVLMSTQWWKEKEKQLYFLKEDGDKIFLHLLTKLGYHQAICAK